MAIERTAQVKRRKGTPAPKSVPVGDLTITSDVKPGVPDTIRGILFGPPKTGKTTAACGTKGQKTLLFSFDPDGHATETLIGRDEDLTIVTPRTKVEIDEIIKKLHAGAHKQFDWIVVDSLTFLFDLFAGKIVAQVWIDNKDVRREYGRGGAHVIQVLHDLFMLPTNLIVTAHLEKGDTEDEDGVPLETKLGESEVKVAVTPMVWRYVGPAVSFIGRTYKETTWEKEGKTRNKRTRYAVSYNDGERSPAGSRLPMAGEYEVTPTWLTDLATTLKKGQ